MLHMKRNFIALYRDKNDKDAVLGNVNISCFYILGACKVKNFCYESLAKKYANYFTLLIII